MQQKDETLNWLNAWNAPHWMQVFGTGGGYSSVNTQLNRTVDGETYKWYTNQVGTGVNNVEVFATSWVRDLMVARNYADSRFLADLATEGSRMTGLSDANYGFTPGTHSTHDLGMAMDLSLKHYISNGFQLNGVQSNIAAEIAAADKKYTDISAALKNAWSNDKAFDLAELLKQLQRGEDDNKQHAAIKEFFSLYAVTQASNGSLAAASQAFVQAQDKAKAGAALFANTIRGGYLGSAGYNTYEAMRNILGRLGTTFTNAPGHRDHFHITFKPPKLLAIDSSGKNLMAEGPAVAPDFSALASAYAAEPVVHVAQSKTGKERFDVVMDTCQRATRGEVKKLHPTFHIGRYYLKLDVNDPKGVDYLTDAKLSIVTPPKYGSLTLKTEPVYGYQYYVYQAFDNTWLGKDRTEIRVELRGKTYKMIHRIEMTVDEELSDKPYEKYYNGPCDARGRRIAFDSEVSYPLTAGASTTDYSIGQLVTLLDLHHGLADAAGTLLVFEDLPGAALGLHEGGSDWNARITLDSNAAGHGWYVDPTPWSVSDDFLPTSDPNLWLAKPGSGAEGKMDLLSVWLHELGWTTPQRWRAVW